MSDWLTRRGDRARDESGLTMVFVLGVLLVLMLTTAALFNAVQSDITLTQSDLSAKRAYAAAQAGVQVYLYQLNSNASTSAWWETCTNDSVGQTSVPGSTTGASYSYQPAPISPYTSCSTSNPVASLIDPTTGTLRMKFTGYAGSGTTAATKTIVASFKTLSPLSFLWYTVYETQDTALDPYGNCNRFYYASQKPDSSCYIYWVTGDHMNGPMYTQDQFLIYSGSGYNSPTFGRNRSDVIASQVPTTGNSDICVNSNCYNLTMKGTPAPKVTPQVPLPADNSNLLPDAQNHGRVFTGNVTLTINGSTATGYNCTTASSSSCVPISIDLTTTPIIYAVNGSNCSTGYDPTNDSYQTSGGAYYGDTCGNVYIQGSYTAPFTVAADNDVILTGDLRTSEDSSGNPTGTATLGLVADQYVRVMHSCSSSAAPNRTIDAAILTLAHSFFVDNYNNCGYQQTQGTLTVHGAIAQYYRGVVGSVGSSGYLKNYNYDDRLAVILPPYLFDLQNTEWTVFRETLCSPTAASTNKISCSYPG